MPYVKSMLILAMVGFGAILRAINSEYAMIRAEDIFPAFPEFRELQLSDREAWEELIAAYPPYAEHSFANLMTWWSCIQKCKVSQINQNIIIEYWFPGYETYSGLSILGSKKIDETVCAIFDYQKGSGDEAKLVHVPEFVIERIRFPELYNFYDERAYDECIIPVGRFSSFEFMSPPKKSKVRRALINHEKSNIIISELNLGDESIRRQLTQCVRDWAGRGRLNNLGLREQEYCTELIMNASDVGIEGVGLYIEGRLHAFLLYQYPSASRYVIVHIARFSYHFPNLFELAVYEFSRWYAEQGIVYANIENDLGIPALRSIKVVLGPTNFLRKYTVSPGNG